VKLWEVRKISLSPLGVKGRFSLFFVRRFSPDRFNHGLGFCMSQNYCYCFGFKKRALNPRIMIPKEKTFG
jgi:hypothetical protein